MHKTDVLQNMKRNFAEKHGFTYVMFVNLEKYITIVHSDRGSTAKFFTDSKATDK